MVAESGPTATLPRFMTARSLTIAPHLTPLTSTSVRADLSQMDRSLQLTRHYSSSLHGHLNHPNPHSASNAAYQPPTPRNTFKRAVSHRGVAGAAPTKMLPEEERRLLKQRKLLASSESKREKLETMYMSLRSHYVAASKRLGLARLGTDAACMFLLELVGKQQRTLGLRRAKVGMMREAVEGVEWRESVGKKKRKIGEEEQSNNELEGVYQLMESTIVTSESTPSSDNTVSSMLAFTDSATGVTPNQEARHKRAPKSKQVKGNAVVDFVGSTLPQTPYGVPLLLTALSATQDRVCASSYGEVFGAANADLVWQERGMPNSEVHKLEEFRARDAMIAELKRITDGIEAFREDTFRLQKETNKVRVDSERITQRITIVRTETEAVLNRHHTVLDTEEGRAASSTLQAMEKKHEKENAMARMNDAAESQVNSDAEDGSDDEEEASLANANEEAADKFEDAVEEDLAAHDDDDYSEPAKKKAAEAPVAAKGGRKGKVVKVQEDVTIVEDPTFEDVQEVAEVAVEEIVEEVPAAKGKGRGKGKRVAAASVGAPMPTKRSRRGK